MTDIEKHRRLLSEEVPGIRVSKLRRLASPCGDDRLRVILSAPAGLQEVILAPRWRGFGHVYEALCACGSRALILRLDERTGWWRCTRCLHLRSARSWGRGKRAYTDLILPILLMERERRKLSGVVEARGVHDMLARLERETLAKVEAALDRITEVADG